MYGNRRSSQPLKSLTDMPLVQRSDLARQRERSLHSGIGSDLGFMQDPILQRKGMSLPDRSLGSSILGDPPLMSTPKGFSASGLGRVSSALPGARETSMSAFRQDAPMARNTRQREGLGRSLGEDTLQRAGLGRSLQQDNMERERLERERQRQVDLQRRAELQRDLELERAKMRRQKQEEERERELQEDMRRRREEERLRDLEREREEERIREREREIERQEEKERERRRIQMERERTEREILQKKALIQQRKEKLQHEIAQNRERKLQQDYEENEKRRALERQRRNEVEAKRHQEMEMQEARKIQMLREREAAIEQQLAFNREQQMAISAPPQQMMMMQQQQQMQMMATAQQQRPAIPSLVNMPIPMGPAPTFKSNNDDASFMEKVRLQQALLAQQNQGQGPSVNRNQNQNRKNRGRNNRQGAGNQKRGQQNKPGDRKQPGNRNQAGNRKGKSRWGQPSPQQGKKPASAAGNKKTGSAAGSKQPESVVQKNGADMSPQKNGASNSKDKPNDEVLYDPLHPTEDEETETGARKRRRSEGELQVRIEQGKTSRDVLDPPGAKQAKLSVESSQASMTNAGQQADKMLKMMQLPHSMEWKCHACNIKCNEVMNYHRHMMGRRHQNMMAHIMEVAQTNTTEALESLKVDKYLARVYKGYKSRGESTERQSAHFCSACLTYVFGPMQGHKASAAHKNALASKNQKCKICNKNFKTLTAFLNHCNTMAHKMMFEVHSMKELKVEASRKAAEKTFVTLDEVGFEGEIENKESSTAKGAKGPASKLTADQKRVDSVFQKLLRKPRAAQASQAVDPTATPKSDPSLAQGPANSGLTPEIVGQIKNLPWTAEDLVSFNPDKILGQEYVIPVTGYFCKLCRKFYNSENSARVIHCKSQSHFKNLQKMNDEMKLAAELVKKDEKPEPTEGAKPAEETKPEAVTEEKETKSVESDNKNETTEEITKEEQEESEVKEEIKEENREVTKKKSGELKVKLDKIEIPAEEGDEKGEDTMEDEKPQEEEKENVVKEDEEGMDQETEDDGAGSTEAEDTIEEGSQEDIFVDQGDQEGGEDLLGGGEEDAGDDDGEAVEQDEILETTGEEEMAMDA